jgi:lipopolysaccharide assembly protein A
MRLVLWLVRALIFFTLFAFALNNQHEAGIRWFFGYEWRAPMVFVVLAAFSAGCVLGVLAMLPSWWKHRRVAQRHRRSLLAEPEPTSSAPAVAPPPPDIHPPRDGL